MITFLWLIVLYLIIGIAVVNASMEQGHYEAAREELKQNPDELDAETYDFIMNNPKFIKVMSVLFAILLWPPLFIAYIQDNY